MYMLPPRPLGETAGLVDGLYLVTLVDERYWWQYVSASLLGSGDYTWDSLLIELESALGITLAYDPIPLVYGTPEYDSYFWTNIESAAALLDAVAYNIGRVVVRRYDGTYELDTPAESVVIAQTNRGDVNQLYRVAGGDLFLQSGTTALPVKGLDNSRNTVVPAGVTVTFPLYVVGDDPVPHFMNPRYANPRPSAWIEESYGNIWPVNVPIQSGGSLVSGLIGTGGVVGLITSGSFIPAPEFSLTIQDTAKALISGEAAYHGDAQTMPLNQSGLVALAVQIASD